MAKKKPNDEDSIEDAVLADELAEEIPSEQASKAMEIDVETEAVAESNFEKEKDEPASVKSENSPTQSQRPIGFGSSLIALLIGGLAAGGIGYFAANYGSADYSARIEANSVAVRDLNAQVEAIPDPTEIGPLEDSLSLVSSDLARLESEIESTFLELSERIVALEKQPSSDGTLQDVALEAYQREIDALRDQIAGQQSELQSMMNATAAQLQATRDEAIAIESRALEAAKAAQVRSAISKIQSGLESGAPIASHLDEFASASGDQVPQELIAVAEGAPTLVALTTEFPAVARTALSVAREEGLAGEESGGLASFLKDQLSIRSTVPQQGDGVDAILSRAEEELVSGHLAGALIEIQSLPEIARSSMSEWLAKAELRSDAVASADALFTKYNAN